MHKNYFTLRALTAHFAATLNRHRFLEAYCHQPGELTLVFLDEQGMTDLRVITGVQEGCLFLVPHSNPPKNNVVRFFEPLAGATLRTFSMERGDRTVTADFGERGTLRIRMFGSGGGNVLRCAADGTIEETFKKERAADRAPVVAPLWDELLRNEKLFASTLRQGSLPLATALNKSLPSLGKPLIEELLLRTNADGTRTAQEIGATAMSDIFRTASIVVDECLRAPQPKVYLDGGSMFALIPLKAREGAAAIECPSVNDGVRRWVGEHGKAGGAQQERQRIASALRTYRTHLDQMIQQVRGDVDSRKDERWQRMGELLLANIADVPAEADRVSIEGTDIVLNPAMNAGQNASTYFEKAKHRKASVAVATRRLENLIVKRDAAVLREREFAAVHTRDELEAYVLRYHTALTQMDHENPNAPKEHPYRSYRLSDECEVFVGKNAKQNDELTFHFAKQNDLWFHVRGAEGSHTILRYNRRELPPKEFIIKAASIAAFHSKAKSSKLVPVLYTQRKFVHKPRGAKPGSVVAQREEVVMVAPGVPKGVVSSE